MPINESIKENYLVHENPMPLGVGVSDYRHMLGNISDELVEKSKNHVSDYDVIKHIRAIMSKINIQMTEL